MKGQKPQKKVESKPMLKTLRSAQETEARRDALRLTMLLTDRGYSTDHSEDYSKILVKAMPGGKFVLADLVTLAPQYGFRFGKKCDLVQDKIVDGDKLVVALVLERTSKN